MADPNGGDSAGGARTAILMKRATAASMAVAGTLVIVKVAAWLATGSVAMLSSVIDSLLDVVASFINLVAVHQALIPADAEHRFGHGKAEAVAGLGQSAIITGSAAFLLFQAGERLIHPVEIANSRVGIAVMLFSMVLTLGLVIFQRRVVRATKSIAISADSLHFESDFLMNLGVIVALVLSSNFGFVRADPIIAMAIAFYVARSAWKIWQTSIDQVMDRELRETDRAKICELVRSHPDIIDLHDLRTRSSGTRIFIQFHIEVPADCSLRRAHDISDQAEAMVAQVFPGAEILVHFDPHGIQEKRADFGRE